MTTQFPDNPQDDAFWQSLFATEEKSLPADSADTSAPSSYFPEPAVSPNPKDLPVTVDEAADKWEAAREACAADAILELTVTGFNKGGLLVYWNGLQGFVPASQLNDLPQFHIQSRRVQALQDRIGRRLQLKIIEVNQRENRFVLSERSTTVNADERIALLHEIEVDQIYPGRITNLTNFGAFVDLGGIEGLIHISELSWRRVLHPGDIVAPDQEVSVLVLSVDREKERVALSLKQIQPDPWLSVLERYRPGQIVSGVVSNVVNYGAFVLLGKGLEGLIHISELANGTFLHPRNVLRKGEQVRARILSVDAETRRLALSLRDLERGEESQPD